MLILSLISIILRKNFYNVKFKRFYYMVKSNLKISYFNSFFNGIC